MRVIHSVMIREKPPSKRPRIQSSPHFPDSLLALKDNKSLFMRKLVFVLCEQQRHRSASASVQSD